MGCFPAQQLLPAAGGAPAAQSLWQGELNTGNGTLYHLIRGTSVKLKICLKVTVELKNSGSLILQLKLFLFLIYLL